MLGSVGYDPSAERLVVQFHNGSVYEYSGVPEGVFVAMLTDEESQGKAFNRLIKGAAFPVKQIKLDEI